VVWYSVEYGKPSREQFLCRVQLEKTKRDVAEHMENPAGFKRKENEIPL